MDFASGDAEAWRAALATYDRQLEALDKPDLVTMCYRHKLTELIYGPKASWAQSRRLRRLVNRLLREHLGHMGHVS